MEPRIIIGGDAGLQNSNLDFAKERVKRGKIYKDLSTVCVIPTRGVIPARVVESWMNLQNPMNQPLVRMFVEGMEVGDAYNQAVEIILQHPALKKFKYMLTLEEDNLPPPDGLVKLFESIEEYAVVAGLYWTKGEGGMPMIYGNPKEILKFNPQVPRPNMVQECNGTGMGFTLFDMKLFKDKKIEKPWFKTDPGHTQDLYFMGKARKAGYRIASDNRVRVGHWDQEQGVAW